MNERDRIHNFSRQIERLVRGIDPGHCEEALDDEKLLEVARRLAKLDFSRQSQGRQTLRSRLIETANRRRQPWFAALSFAAWRVKWALPEIRIRAVNHGLPAMFTLLVLCGLFFGSLNWLPLVSNPQPLSVYTPSAALMVTGDPMSEFPGEGQILPQPIPTPLAPVEEMLEGKPATGLQRTPFLISTGDPTAQAPIDTP